MTGVDTPGVRSQPPRTQWSSSIKINLSREHEKGGDQVLTERYQPSRKQGERHSAPVYVRRGQEYPAAVALLDQATKHRQHATCVRGDHAATCREDITH